MTRLTSQRGVSLMLLILAITVFAAVAIGIVTLLRSRHESYPYQVQSYQAYALAHAGVEFATRYAKDNADVNGDFQTFLTANLPATAPGRQFNFGNGSFWLRYDPGTSGCNDKLYSRGTVGTATREVMVSSFGGFASRGASSALYTEVPAGWTGGQPTALYISGAIRKDCYGYPLNPSCIHPTSPYSGDQISFGLCDVSSYTRNSLDTVGGPYSNWFEWSGMVPGNPPPIRIGATNAVNIMRVAYGERWVWDGTCQGSCPGFTYTGVQSPVVWDGTTTPPPTSQSVQLDFNTVGNQVDYLPNADQYCRPQKPCDANTATCCNPDPGCNWLSPNLCCSSYPTLGQCCYDASYANCTDPQSYQFGPAACSGGGSSGPTRTYWTCRGAPGSLNYVTAKGSAPLVIQTLGSIPSGTKFYVSFWTRPHHNADAIGDYFHNQLQVQSAMTFTVP